MISRLSAALGLVLITAFSVARVSRPPSPLPASSPDTVFSAERAMRHVEQIAQRPHPMGTADHDRVRDYILGQLAALGMKTEVQTATAVGTRYQEAGRVQNVIGYLPGSAPSGKAVLLMVHYDGVGAGPAASDDGAGCAALLEALRAIRARKTPLRQDIIALFTDGEESGLLGAAAFVREHPRAKDVAIVLNFEARGTAGRSFMFETGPGNLDAVRMLRRAGDVTAGSVFTTVYRALPNDTDLSELAVLGLPALNFAFTTGVERYHTTRDAPEYLDHGSLQHHGAQLLAVGSALANGELPRPRTGDAAFFDLPLIGLVVYPLWVAYVVGAAVLALFIAVVWPLRRHVPGSLAAMVLGLVVCGVLAAQVELVGPAMWSGWYGAAIAAAAIGVNAALYVAADRKWGEARAGGLTLWTLIAVALSVALPAVSYLFAWPVLFALVAARSRRPVAEWISALFALTLLAGLASTTAVVMLGVRGTGAVALVVLVSLLTWLVGPLLAPIFGGWRSALGIPLAGAAALLIVARIRVHETAAHPARSSLVYAESADGGDAFFGSPNANEGWTNGVLRPMVRGPAWTTALGATGAPLYGHGTQHLGLDAPSAAIVSDSATAAGREVTFRIAAPRGVTAVVLHASGARVLRTAVDGRVVDTTRFRRRLPEWGMEYWNVPAEGALIALLMPVGSHGALTIAARRPGLPAALAVPARPDLVVPSQDGDVSVVYRRIAF